MFMDYSDLKWSRAKELSRKFIDVIRDYHADYLEEIRGVADGSGFGFEDILALNCRSEIVFVGKEFGAKTVYTSLLLPVFLYIFEVLFPNNPSLTNDMTLDALCCVLLISVGQALMFNANASSGGLDIIGKVINKYTHIELGQSIAVVGALTVASSILVYDTKTLVIGFLGTYFNGIVIDSFISGFSRRKRVCILSQHHEQLADYIMHDLHRGVTLYEAKGGYDNSEKLEIVTILAKNEYAQLMEYIRNNDPKAFVTVSTVSEVVGYWNSNKKR